MKISLSQLIKVIKKLRKTDYLIVIAVLLSGVIVFKFFNPEEKWVDANLYVQEISVFQANTLRVGDIEKDPGGKTTAKITGIQIYDSRFNPNTNITTNKNLFIRLKVLVDINQRNRSYEYKNKVIKVGSSVQFAFDSGQITGTIIELDSIKSSSENIEKILTLRLYNQWPWFADSLKIGSGEIGENNQKVIEVLSKEITPAQITTADQFGEARLGVDPQKIDITLKVKIKAQQFSTGLTFRREQKILIGDTFSFNAGSTRIKDANIIDIE